MLFPATCDTYETGDRRRTEHLWTVSATSVHGLIIDRPGVIVFGNYVKRQLRPRGNAGIRVLRHFNTGVFNTGNRVRQQNQGSDNLLSSIPAQCA